MCSPVIRVFAFHCCDCVGVNHGLQILSGKFHKIDNPRVLVGCYVSSTIKSCAIMLCNTWANTMSSLSVDTLCAFSVHWTLSDIIELTPWFLFWLMMAPKHMGSDPGVSRAQNMEHQMSSASAWQTCTVHGNKPSVCMPEYCSQFPTSPGLYPLQLKEQFCTSAGKVMRFFLQCSWLLLSGLRPLVSHSPAWVV